MVTRRNFIRAGALFVPTIFIPRLRADVGAFTFGDIASQNKAGGVAAGCTTARDANTAANNGHTTVGQTSASAYVATFFTAAATYTACELQLYIDKLGTPNWSLFASIYTDSGSDTPGTLIGDESDAVATSGLGTTEAAVTFSNFNASISSATRYFIVLRCSATGDLSNHVRWYRNSVSAGTNSIVASADGLTWSNISSSRRNKFQGYSA